jgi:uncharacterized membrane protein YdjX (TVP38/TMEM64 family)
LGGGLIVFFLLVFGVAHLRGWTVLVDDQACRAFLVAHGRWLAALLGVGLLTADVILPVASSAVMFAHGRLFGVLVGALLSLAGSLGAAWLGWLLGRAGGRWAEKQGQSKVTGLVSQWGILAVVVSRPVPVLAESVAIVAGAAGLGWGRLTLGTVAGALPPAILYAWAGATAQDWTSGLVVFGLVLAAAGVCWWVGQRWSGSVARKASNA